MREKLSVIILLVLVLCSPVFARRVPTALAVGHTLTEPPFTEANFSANKWGNATVTLDRDTGRIWAASAHDIFSGIGGSENENISISCRSDSFHYSGGKGKLFAGATVDFPTADIIESGRVHIVVSMVIVNEDTGSRVPLITSTREIRERKYFGRRYYLGSDRELLAESETDVFPEGNYYMGLSISIRPEDGGLVALGGGNRRDVHEGVKVQSMFIGTEKP